LGAPHPDSQTHPAPRFPAKDFFVSKYGARADGRTDCTDAFRQTIEEAARAGGGRVLVPAGAYLSGAIHLKNNVNLVVEKDATIKFFTEPKFYPIVLTRFEGLECMNYSPLIYALDRTNVAVTGEGTLDGGSDQ
jgi:polygalacturonase